MYSWETHPPYCTFFGMKVEDIPSSLYTCTTLLVTFKDTALFFVCKRTMSEMKSCISSILKQIHEIKAQPLSEHYNIRYHLQMDCIKVVCIRQLFTVSSRHLQMLCELSCIISISVCIYMYVIVGIRKQCFEHQHNTSHK